MQIDWKQLLEAAKPVLKPIAMQLWVNAIYPELQKLDDGITQEDLKLVGEALLVVADRLVKKHLEAM